jgi:fumarate reductase subunit D
MVTMARSSEPLWWGPFSAGMMVGALCVPALIIITAGMPVIRDFVTMQKLLNHLLTRLFLFVVISLSFFHWAHRFRYIILDLGVHGGRMVVAVLCYGAAIIGTVLAGAIALQWL